MDVRIFGKTLATRFDAFGDAINRPEILAMVFEIMRPAPEPRRDLQYRFGRQTIADPRENRAEPLRGRSPPRLRPFFARIFPIVFRPGNGRRRLRLGHGGDVGQ